MRFSFIVVIFFIHLTINGKCQEASKSSSIGLGIGVDIVTNKDIAASPLEYKGFGLPIGLNVFSDNQNWIHNFELNLILPFLTNNYPLKTRADTQLKNWGKVNVHYSLLKHLGSENYLGGRIDGDFFLREYDFLDGVSWDIMNSLDVTYARRLKFSEKSSLLSSISVPMIAFIHRKPSLTFDEQFLDDLNIHGVSSLIKYGDWHLIGNDWLGIDLDFLYQLNISENFIFQSRIGLNYYIISSPEKVTNFNIPIRCYINYRL